MRTRIRPKIDRPSVKQIKSWFSYEPAGVLRWQVDVRNGRKEGYVKYRADTEVVPARYVTLNQKTLVIADMIYVLMVGRWPTRRIDHKDGNPRNRRWDNLRLATQQQNMMNQRVHSNNTSGYPGVVWCDKRKRGIPKWSARITYKGKRISLGLYLSKADAIAARKDAEQKYFGKWARVL